MDNDQQMQLIENRFDTLENMRINDQSAREALTYVMLTVSPHQPALIASPCTGHHGGGNTHRDILERLRGWLDRLVNVLTRIVEKLANATSFSVSAGANVSVTVDFGPFESGSA